MFRLRYIAVSVLTVIALTAVATGPAGAASYERWEVDAAIAEASRAHGVSLARLTCVVRRESGFNPSAVNGSFLGLTQQHRKYWAGRVKWYNANNDLKTPDADWQNPRTMMLVSSWMMRGGLRPHWTAQVGYC